MKHEGPELEQLLRRLSECPDEFLRAGTGQGECDAVAIVFDHMRAMTPDAPPELSAFAERIGEGPATRLTLMAVIAWLLHDRWFLERPELTAGMWQLFTAPKLTQLVRLVKPKVFVDDPDRREELVRVCLSLLQLRPRGESVATASDRLTTLDSVERERLLRATAAAERRAREVREAMVKARAQEAASRYGE